MATAVAAMPEQRSRFMVAAAVLFAAIAAVLVFVALQQGSETATTTTSAATTGVVVAARDIPANTTLTPGMLTVQAVPAGSELDGAYAASDGLIGLPTRFPVAAGEQITPLKLGLNRIDDENDVALVLEAGTRAISVPLTEVTGVGGLLLPGNFVDVIAVFSDRSGGPGEARTLLQNVEVLAVGQEAQEPLPAAAGEDGGPAAGVNGRRPDDVERQPDARSATLAVTPEQAQLLALVRESGGVIWLSLRPTGDHETAETGTTRLPQAAEVVPPAAP